MGCWCETCGITQLPINAGDKVRVFILIEQKHYAFHDGGSGGGGTCYQNERWAPIGPPLQGEYDEYGGIEHIVMDDAATMIQNRLNEDWVPVVRESKYDDKVSDKPDLSEYLHFIERDRGKLKGLDGTGNLGLMFVLEDIYQTMLEHNPIIAHHNWEKHSYKYMPLKESLMLEIQEWYSGALERMKLLADKPEKAMLYEILIESRLFYDCNQNGLKGLRDQLLELAKAGLPWEDAKVQELVKMTHNMFLFNMAMGTTRKQWIPQSGKGGQHNELELYQALADATQKVIDDRAAESVAYGNDVPDENGYYPFMISHNQEELKKEEDAKEGK